MAPIPCTVTGCGKTFTERKTMYRHIKSVHLRQGFICNICGTYCARKDLLDRHMERRHSGQVETVECAHCGVEVTEGALKGHWKSVKCQEQQNQVARTKGPPVCQSDQPYVTPMENRAIPRLRYGLSADNVLLASVSALFWNRLVSYMKKDRLDLARQYRTHALTLHGIAIRLIADQLQQQAHVSTVDAVQTELYLAVLALLYTNLEDADRNALTGHERALKFLEYSNSQACSVAACDLVVYSVAKHCIADFRVLSIINDEYSAELDGHFLGAMRGHLDHGPPASLWGVEYAALSWNWGEVSWPDSERTLAAAMETLENATDQPNTTASPKFHDLKRAAAFIDWYANPASIVDTSSQAALVWSRAWQ